MKKQAILIALFLIFKPVFSQELKKEDYETVKKFVDCIKNDNISKLKTMIDYPLKRQAPLQDIKNENEFEKRSNEIFDDNLKNMIISSNINESWSAVGWRGIMFKNGELWIDYDGKIIAINYQSAFERNKINKLTEKDKTSLRKSVPDKYINNPN